MVFSLSIGSQVIMEIPLELMLTISQKLPWMFFPDIIPVGHPIFDIINSTNPEVHELFIRLKIIFLSSVSLIWFMSLGPTWFLYFIPFNLNTLSVNIFCLDEYQPVIIFIDFVLLFVNNWYKAYLWMADWLGFKVSVSSAVCIWSRWQLLAALWWFSTKYWRMYKLTSSLRGRKYVLCLTSWCISFHLTNYKSIIWSNESTWT